MHLVPTDIREKLTRFGQTHVLRWWDALSDCERDHFAAQMRSLDLGLLRQLFENRHRTFRVPSRDEIDPLPVVALEPNAGRREAGEKALRNGKVAVLVVAGGQGSRLGFEHAKGMFPIGPVSNKTLFQIHAEKTLALRKRYGGSVPLLVMTSPTNDAETRDFFEEHDYFGLPALEVFFFAQGTLPALERESGRLIMDRKDHVFVSPNGHGGVLAALADSGLLDRMIQRGVEHLFYFQVDNPLVKVADPLFLGYHLNANAQVSSKVVAKEGPTDKLGNMVVVDGRCTIIEYSDLPSELGSERDAEGNLRLWAGSPAIHFFDLHFLKHIAGSEHGLPYHVARKKVPFLGDDGRVVEPKTENALKFEMFIFDVLPMAERWFAAATSREEEFMPLKNASGADSPEAVRQAISNLAAIWLENAGIDVPRLKNRDAAVLLEISPLFALDAEELAARLKPELAMVGPLYLGDAVGAGKRVS